MGKFDTHGGYFAPKDYMKVETGGSHEENPNGGVQIGVDGQGTPNLLEEGEPVYKDYVYSDNIKASERFLKDNNIPEKYAGELYSKIADKFFEEAEDRPYDPISRNGLEAMLGRLAEAQEAQKAYNEQRKLEREISSLSPEEMVALEQMLAQGEQMAPEEQMQPEPMMQQPAPEQMVPVEQTQEQIPMMGCGGKIGRKYETGGPKGLLRNPVMVQAITGNPSTYATSGAQIPRVESTVGNELGYMADVVTAPYALLTPGLTTLATASEVADMAGSNGMSVNRASLTPVVIDGTEVSNLRTNAAGRYTDELGKLLSKDEVEIRTAQHKADMLQQKSAKFGETVFGKVLSPAARAVGKAIDTVINPLSQFWKPTKGIGKVGRFVGNRALNLLEYDLGSRAIDWAGDVKRGLDAAQQGQLATETPNLNKYGGNVNRYDSRVGTGWLQRYYKDKIAEPVAGLTQFAKDAISKGIRAAKDKTRVGPSVNGLGDVVGTVPVPEVDPRIDPNAYIEPPKKNKDIIWDTIYAPTQIGYYAPSVRYKEVARPEREHGSWPIDGNYYWNGPVAGSGVTVVPGDNPEVQVYGEIPELVITANAGNTGGGRVTSGVKSVDPLQAIIDSTNERIANEELPTVDIPYVASSSMYSRMKPALEHILSKVDLSSIGNPSETTPVQTDDVTSTVVPDPIQKVKAGNPYLSTFPRYAGAIGGALLGLYNVFQKPDKYTSEGYRPFVPYGRINLQNQVYNPVDQNMMLNQVLAQGNSTARALRNSGLGPSTAAALIAQDNNISGNIGNTLLQTWDANNQRRNAVTAANNQAEAQRAQFDFNVDYARTRALAEAQIRNAQNNLMLQQLNYGSEGDRYAAIGNQISGALKALSNIGQENFAMNQVNSNTALEGYRNIGGGVGAYLPWYYRPMDFSCGGTIKRKK